MNLDKQNRVRRLIEAVKKHDTDWVLCMLPENIYYFSGFRTMLYTRFVGMLASIKENREPVLIVSSIDRELALKKIWSPNWFKEIVLWGPDADMEYKTHWDVLKVYLRPGIRLGVDGIQYNFFEQLTDIFPGLEIINITPEIQAIQQIKSPEEIRNIQAAYALAEKVMGQVPLWLQEPLTEVDLSAEMDRMGRKQGADGFCFPTLVSCGEKMLAFHSPPLPRPIKENELIRVAFGPTVNGYGSDILRTFCKGQPPPNVLPIKNAFFDAQEAVFDMLRPGVTSQELLKTVSQMYQKRGCLQNWGNNIGHGLGLTIHEPPRIAGTDATRMQADMILAIEPSLKCLPYGSFAHCDGVRITEKGCEMLSSSMRDLVLV